MPQQPNEQKILLCLSVKSPKLVFPRGSKQKLEKYFSNKDAKKIKTICDHTESTE